MILVTGLTGRVGGAAASHLASQGHAVRGLARNERKAADWTARGMDVVMGDLDDADAIATALQGVQTALLVAPNTEQQLDRERRFIDVAVEQGLRRVVKLSSSEVAPDLMVPFPRAHYLSETHLRASGLEWTMLRPDYYLQNFLLAAPGIARGNVFHLPFGETTVAPVDTRDIGEAAAIVLADDRHAGKVYHLTGNDLLTFAEIAQRMSSALGREIRYIDQDPQAFREFMAGILDSDWHVDALAQLFDMIKHHPVTRTHPDLEQLIGRRARSVETFTQDYRQVFNH